MLAPLLLSTILAQTAGAAPSMPPADRGSEHADDDFIPSRRLYVGLELRADLWRHPVRPALGVSAGAFDITAILDPGVFIDGKNDFDLIAGWWLAPRAWRLSLGWRNSSTRIGDGRRFSESLLLGLDAAMPLLNGRHVRATFGVAVAADMVRHGGDVPTRTIPLGSFADVSDFVTVTFNARFEFATGF
jgi:hypothetical protein